MKKWIAYIICISLLLALSGCQSQVNADATNVNTQNTAATEPSQLAPSTPLPAGDQTDPTEPPVETTPAVIDSQDVTGESLAAVTLIPTLEETQAEDGTTIFQFKSQSLTVYLPDASDAAHAIMDSMAASYGETASAAQEILSWAQRDYQAGANWTPYSCQISYEPARIDTAVISFSGTVWQVSGGMHPNYSLVSRNYDTATGERLTLEDVLNHADMAQALYLKVMDGLDQFAETAPQGSSEIVYNDGYEQVVGEHFDLNNSLSEAWYFGSDGMTFYFSPYELAPYAVGGIQIQVPYSELAGILKDEYFPIANTYDQAFSINAALEAQVNPDNFSQVLTTVLDAEGEGIAVFSGGTIYNVQLSLGSWDENGTAFQASQVLFAANRLTDQDLLLIRAFIPDTQPSLRLTMRTGESQYRTYYITQSGLDGSILLLENP